MYRRLKYMGATTSPGFQSYPLQVWDWLTGARQSAGPSERHLKSTMDWMAHAQDASEDDGVCRMYHLKKGWGAAYPETTGYIIPTFLGYAEFSADESFRERAIRMAKWESSVQLESGAVQGGVIGDPPTPAIFNTGQVIFGWCSAYAVSGNEVFRESAIRAADYLVDQLDEDGAWRKNLSAFTTAPIDTYAYNVRNAWALMLAQRLDGDKPYADAARSNVEFVLSLCHENGWIEKNCLARHEQPLLHTIAYAFQGLVEYGVLASFDPALEIAVQGNSALLENLDQFGRLHGRYEQAWNPTVRWRCLTGEAQTAIVWQRLGQITGDGKWTAGAARLIELLKKTQKLHARPGIEGGVKGSWPITAPYGRMQYLNWAAKFFADALMLQLGVADAGSQG